MKSSRFLWLCIAALLVTCLEAPMRGATNRVPELRPMLDPITSKYPPSVVLILADDLGFGDLGCYGQTEIRTPNMDRLAAQGIRYTDFYAGSPASAASRCALITGRHTGHSSIRGDEGAPLPQGEMTLARMLAPAEYQTGLLGSWGLGLAGSTGEPIHAGFNEVRALLDVRTAGINFPASLYRNGEEWTLTGNQSGGKGQYLPDLMLLMATNFLRTAQYRPFLLIYSSTLPRPNLDSPDTLGKTPQAAWEGSYAKKDWPTPEKRKAALITRLDYEVGVLMAHLEANKMFKNTYVFLTSDGGPHSNGGVNASFLKSSGPFRGGRGDLLEGGIRVPMIAWSPNKIPGGRVSDQIWAAWDFVPTVAELAGMPKPKAIDGISVARSLHGLVQTNHHDFLYWETHEPHTRQAVRMGQWKGIRPALGEPLELYDLKADPAEKQNVAASHPDIVEKLETYLKTARSENPLWPLKPANGSQASPPPQTPKN